MFDLHMKIYVKVMKVHWPSHINLYESHVKSFLHMKMHWPSHINLYESHVKSFLHMKMHWPSHINLYEVMWNFFCIWRCIDLHILIYMKVVWKVFAFYYACEIIWGPCDVYTLKNFLFNLFFISIYVSVCDL